jgi:uncharacterized membrane protein
MIDGYARALTLVAAAGAGLAAGFYFAFSAVVMKALGRLPSAQGVRAMQSINDAAPRPWVATCLGTALVCVVLTVAGFRDLGEPWAAYLIAGSALYLGSVVVTFAFHIPRNDSLALVDPSSPRAADTWSSYLSSWTWGNHVRALTSLAGAVAFILALRVR